MVIFSSTGEFESRNLMQSSSDLMPAMPTIFTSRNWPNKHFQWSLSQKSVTGPTTACSSGRAYMESRIYKKPIISPCSGIRYKLIRQFFFLPFLSFFISFFFFVLRKKKSRCNQYKISHKHIEGHLPISLFLANWGSFSTDIRQLNSLHSH